MNKAMLVEAETLIGKICTTIESGNHGGEVGEAVKRLRAHIPTLRKAAVTVELASGTAATAMSLDELIASWDARLSNAAKNAPPHLREQARDAELVQLMKELKQIQNSGVAAREVITDVSAQVAALKSDEVDLSKLSPEERTLYLIKAAQRNSRIDPRSLLCR